jgi:hypothetical protein
LKKEILAVATTALLLVLLIAFISYYETQSSQNNGTQGTSYPYGSLIMVGQDPVTISPNGTNIPVNVPIQVELGRGSAEQVGDITLTPPDPVSFRDNKNVVLGSIQVTFHLSKLLQPNTNYTVTIPIMNETVTWNFKTSS